MDVIDVRTNNEQTTEYDADSNDIMISIFCKALVWNELGTI